jgi:hypothetical protein
MQVGPFDNQAFIAIGREAIRLMQLPRITSDVLLHEMDAIIRQYDINDANKCDARWTTQ